MEINRQLFYYETLSCGSWQGGGGWRW